MDTKNASEARDTALNSPVTALNGVGKVRAAAYARLGIFTLYDLIRHFPRAYENRGNICLLSGAPENTRTSVVLTVATVPKTALVKGRMQLFGSSDKA